MEFEKQSLPGLARAGRVFSIALMSGFFVAVLYMLVFASQALKENLLVFGLAFLVLVVVNVVFPRVIKTGFGRGMRLGAKEFAEKFSLAIAYIGLTITYFIGVGFVWFVSRIAGKRFMEIQPAKKESYWIEKKGLGSDEEMF